MQQILLEGIDWVEFKKQRWQLFFLLRIYCIINYYCLGKKLIMYFRAMINGIYSRRINNAMINDSLIDLNVIFRPTVHEESLHRRIRVLSTLLCSVYCEVMRTCPWNSSKRCSSLHVFIMTAVANIVSSEVYVAAINENAAIQGEKGFTRRSTF